MQKFSRLYYVMLALCATAMFSCGKDDDGGDPDPTNPSSQKCIVTNVASTNGTNEYTEAYEYNSKRQITKISYTEDGVALTDYQTVEYNAQGRISKSSYIESGVEVYYEEYEYNNNGLLSKKSEFYKSSPTGPLSLQGYDTYQYNNDKKVTLRESFTGQGVKSYYNVYTYPAGNSAKKEGFDVDAGGNATLDYTTEYTFDDKKSPQLVLGVLIDDEVMSYNNMLTEKETMPGGTPSTTTFAYEYNSDGFPTKITRTRPGSVRITNLTYNCK